jgi:hypothetical protein
MRWLVIALLISVGGLLVAAAGTARHILLQRTKLKRRAPKGDAAVVGTPETPDGDSEP